jgi:hypothetical protein
MPPIRVALHWAVMENLPSTDSLRPHYSLGLWKTVKLLRPTMSS